MPEPGHADEGFFMRRMEVEGGKEAIEVCAITDDPVDCKVFQEGTAEFAVAEKLLDLLEAQDKHVASEGLYGGLPVPEVPVTDIAPALLVP